MSNGCDLQVERHMCFNPQYLPPKFNLYNGHLKRNLIENTKSCSKTKTLKEDFD